MGWAAEEPKNNKRGKRSDKEKRKTEKIVKVKAGRKGIDSVGSRKKNGGTKGEGGRERGGAGGGAGRKRKIGSSWTSSQCNLEITLIFVSYTVYKHILNVKTIKTCSLIYHMTADQILSCYSMKVVLIILKNVRVFMGEVGGPKLFLNYQPMKFRNHF